MPEAGVIRCRCCAHALTCHLHSVLVGRLKEWRLLRGEHVQGGPSSWPGGPACAQAPSQPAIDRDNQHTHQVSARPETASHLLHAVRHAELSSMLALALEIKGRERCQESRCQECTAARMSHELPPDMPKVL